LYTFCAKAAAVKMKTGKILKIHIDVRETKRLAGYCPPI
jgi:hypothetical protein